MESYKGTCFCGAVEVEVTGKPEAMGFCHCTSCREWSAAPVNSFVLWRPENVKVTKGKENLGVYNRTPKSDRQFCRTCGGHVMTAHPGFNLVDVYAATIPSFGYDPQLHIYYGEKVLALRDGLPKFNDLPKEFGGSGETLPD